MWSAAQARTANLFLLLPKIKNMLFCIILLILE